MSRNLKEETVDGDGHCVVHSIIEALHTDGRTDYTGSDILEAATAELSKHLSYYRGFTTDDQEDLVPEITGLNRVVI